MLLRYLFPFKATVPYSPLKSRQIQNPQTIGEEILNRRLELGLYQKDVALIIGVCEDSVTFWENNRAQPQRKHAAKIAAFLRK
jgi:DNA-binding XRE family transcriptional regulator